jgi:hypothetical protein
MSKPFFAEIVTLAEFETHFQEREVSAEELLDLLREVEELLHAKTLDLILEELPEEHHGDFLGVFHQEQDNVSHWIFLEERSPSIKERVLAKLEEFKRYLLEELKG